VAYYNEHYLHLSLGYKTSNQFERDYYSSHSLPFPRCLIYGEYYTKTYLIQYHSLTRQCSP
jgi:hypothetical protein